MIQSPLKVYVHQLRTKPLTQIPLDTSFVNHLSYIRDIKMQCISLLTMTFLMFEKSINTTPHIKQSKRK